MDFTQTMGISPLFAVQRTLEEKCQTSIHKDRAVGMIKISDCLSLVRWRISGQEGAEPEMVLEFSSDNVEATFSARRM